MRLKDTHLRLGKQTLIAAVTGFLLPIVVAGGVLIARNTFGLASFAAESRQNLEDIGWTSSSRRTIAIGVSYLPPPKTPDMRIYVPEGFETELAEEIGQYLHAEIKLVSIPPKEQVAALAERRIDALIARVGENDEQHQSIRLLPTGFESGISPVMRSDKPLHQWNELAGHLACLTEANERGKRLAESLGAQVVTFRAPAEALMALRTGECAAALHDRAVLDPLFKKMSWQKFAGTLSPADPSSLMVGIAPDRNDIAADIERALKAVGSAEQWRQRKEKWAELVSFEVYRDQVAADCH